MPLQPLYFAPGICKTSSSYASGKTVEYGEGRIALGRYIDMLWARFTAGFPEKIGGFVALNGNTGQYPALTGIIRCEREWRDLNAVSRMCIATDSHLYIYNGTTFNDITPLRTIASGNIGTSNPITTVMGQMTIVIADTTQNLQVGDWVFLSAGSSPVNGIPVNGWYNVITRTGTNFTVNTLFTATGSGTGGGTVAFGYPRVTLTNPYSWNANDNKVTVTQADSGIITGDYITVSPSFTLAGTTIPAGNYPATVVTTNTYTIPINTGSTAETGVGGAISVTNNIHSQGLTVTSIGYGLQAYGSGAYGVSSTDIPTLVTGWTLAAYGSQMLGAPIGGTIYVFDPSVGNGATTAYPLLNAPQNMNAMFVTPERFVVALGINEEFLTIAWADQNDYTDWTSSATNTAESGRTLQGGSYFMGGVPVAVGVSLIFTNKVPFQMNYSGDNNVYDTPSIADQCGLIGPQAIVVYGEIAYWMSDSDFWMWNGSPSQLPSDDIRDFVFRTINAQYQTKSAAGLVKAKREVWFFYPSSSSTGENDSAVIYHIDQGCWSVPFTANAVLARSAWIDADLFNGPYAGAVNGIVYQQENGLDNVAGGTTTAIPSYITGAPMDVSNGEANLNVFGFIPDFERITQDGELVVTSQYYPEGPTEDFGPFDVSATGQTPRIDNFRADGKLVGYTFLSPQVGSDWRLGLCRADVNPSGARR